ncbi:MAG: BACON domain-containing protein [Prevotella sp.]|nr:BACON domain-containing protein [Prevotella sp.]
MKLRYIIPMFIAAVAMLVSCSDDDKKSYLSAVQVSQSYIALPAGDEGDAADKEFQAEITVNAKGDWEFQNVPEWLTVSPAIGGEGQTTVVFKALKTAESRSAFLKLVCNGQEQEINVIQQAKKTEVPLSTCAEIIAGDNGKTYRAKGTVKSIANTTYGNWYLQDETGEVYIYGTLDKSGAEKNFLSLGIGVGDIVTVEGPKTTYNGTVELVNVTVIAIEKSLIKVDSLDIKNNTISKLGGEFHAVLENKGEGLNVVIPEDAKDWLYVTGISISGTESVVTFCVLPNSGAGRKATVAFVTSSGGKQYTAEAVITQEANVLPHGENPDDPFSVAEAIAKCEAIGSTSDGVIYYAKGIISSISSVDTGSYGNATFNISDDGTDDNALTCFRSYFLDNAKFTAEDQIGVGDEVIITGKLVNYKGTTPEFSGNVYVYKHTKASNDPGTRSNPFNIAQAIAFIDGGGTGEVYVQGVVSELVSGGFSAQYGNGTFWISDDGTKYNDPAKDFEAYRVYWLGNQKWVEGDAQIAVGDKVVLFGELTKYKTTYETNQNKAYVYSVNGKTTK